MLLSGGEKKTHIYIYILHHVPENPHLEIEAIYTYHIRKFTSTDPKEEGRWLRGSSATVTSRHESHGVEGGEAGPHVRRGEPRPRHAPAELLEPRQEERDPAARDEDERQRDEPYAQVDHQHLRSFTTRPGGDASTSRIGGLSSDF
jgi:hypothetical protein|uniref:Uncharacterized protein n=1 Tax=Zea mays TaxID=4577 RepID=A0A804LMG1_MAIZE